MYFLRFKRNSSGEKVIMELLENARRSLRQLTDRAKGTDCADENMSCNLCGGTVFGPMGTRPLARCKTCGSYERTRLLYKYLQRDITLTKDMRVLHLAPEKGLYNVMSEQLDPEKYIQADINPKIYSFAKNIRKMDLTDLDHEPSKQYDLIIHCHVLEHIPCNIAYTLWHLHRMLKDDGLHLCVIPFLGGKYDESFQDLSDEERVKRFGQHDHIRRFGRLDVEKHLGVLVNLPTDFDAVRDFGRENLLANNIQKRSWRGYTTDTVLSLRRHDMKLLPAGM
jgi:phosphoglycolate phosphatase